MKKFFKFIIIFLVVSGWIFSGWPRIWQNPSIPPKVQEVKAATIQKFYLHDASSPDTGTLPSAKLSAATASVTATGASTNRDMTDAIGTAQVSQALTSLGQIALQKHWFRRFISRPLAAQTLPTGAWTLQLGAMESNANANESFNWSITLAVWRPSTGAVVSTLRDDPATSPSATASIKEPGTTETNLATTTPSIAGVAIQDGDILVLEVWAHAVQGNTTARTDTIFYDGTTEGGITSNAAFLNAPAAITLLDKTTYLGNDTNPGVNPTIAPGAATTTVDTFNLKTGSGTDTVTSATTTLSAGSSGGLFGVEITNSGNTTIYCSSYNPSSDTVSLAGCNLPVTSASTTFNIRIKPKSHSAMPAPPGSTYSVTATITVITATNPTSGADTTSDTVTIDNLSPNGATATSGTAGNQQVTLNWTTSNSSDFDTTNGSVILRWAAASAGSEVPAEGNSSYSAGNAIGTATVACVISSAGSTAQTKIDGSGGSAGCTTAALTNGQQYTYKAFQRDTSGNYDVGVAIGTFTPASVSLTFTVDTNSVSFVSAITPGTPVSTSSVLTVNTNNSTGYNIKINRASSTTPTLFLTTDVTTYIYDTPNGNNWTAPTATSTAGPSAVWTVGTTIGLGFRVKQTGTVSNTYSSVWWGTSDTAANALYSGISTSTALQMIANTTLGSATNENTVVEYKLDTATTQKSGIYISSPVTYTATTNP